MVISELKKIPLFKTLSRQALIQLAGFVKVETYPTHRLVFREGQKRDRLYIVLKGSLIIEKTILGVQEPLAAFKPYEVVGESIFFSAGGSHNHSGRTLAPETTLLEISTYHLAKLFRDNPRAASDLQQHMLRTITERLSRTNDKLLTLFAISKLPSNINTREELLTNLLRDLLKLFRVKQALVARFEPLGRKIYIEYTLGYRRKLTSSLKLDQDTLMSMVYSTKKSLVITPENWEKKFSNADYQTKNMLLCPIMSHHQITGCIILADKINGHYFSPNNDILLTAIAQQIGPMLDQLAQRELEKNQANLKNTYIEPFVS
jgi:CRP-like cAMP-binding protein